MKLKKCPKCNWYFANMVWVKAPQQNKYDGWFRFTCRRCAYSWTPYKNVSETVSQETLDITKTLVDKGKVSQEILNKLNKM